MTRVIILGVLLMIFVSCGKQAEQPEVSATSSKNIKVDPIELVEVPLADFENS